jgi:hypothetical protein
MDTPNPIRSKDLEVDEAEDGLVVFDPHEDMVHHLNPTAAVIFDLCDGSRAPDAIAALLGELYELDGPALRDAQTGLHELARRGLIRWDAHEDTDG